MSSDTSNPGIRAACTLSFGAATPGVAVPCAEMDAVGPDAAGTGPVCMDAVCLGPACIGSACAGTSGAGAPCAGEGFTEAASSCNGVGEVSMKIRSSSPGGSVNSSDASKSSDSSPAGSNTFSCAISSPSWGGSAAVDAGSTECRMASARVSDSSDDSPAGNAVASSASRANALNTSPHRPQRTWPPAARKASADNRNTVSHFEHCVYTLSRSAGVYAAPVIPPDDLHHIKTRSVGGLDCVRLRLQQP